MDINNKVAVITGGASGLGEATARNLAANGAKVAILDLNEERAKLVASEIGGIGISCNVCDENAVSAALDTVEAELGIPQILLCSAGIGTPQRVLGRDQVHPLADFSKVIDINLIGTFNVLRLTAERMAKADPNEDNERGAIIMTASVAAFDGQVGQAAYAASKGAVVSMTLPIARELSQFGIRVLTIAPGIFLTPLLANLPKEVQESLGQAIPFPKRLGKPEEFAQLAQQCVENSFLNGEVIRLDGSIRMAPR
jgi:NAD(P)-dependent dehydrogenase (short-subunit alcohol dehydrogenase family)